MRILQWPGGRGKLLCRSALITSDLTNLKRRLISEIIQITGSCFFLPTPVIFFPCILRAAHLLWSVPPPSLCWPAGMASTRLLPAPARLSRILCEWRQQLRWVGEEAAVTPSEGLGRKGWAPPPSSPQDTAARGAAAVQQPWVQPAPHPAPEGPHGVRMSREGSF